MPGGAGGGGTEQRPGGAGGAGGGGGGANWTAVVEQDGMVISAKSIRMASCGAFREGVAGGGGGGSRGICCWGVSKSPSRSTEDVELEDSLLKLMTLEDC